MPAEGKTPELWPDCQSSSMPIDPASMQGPAIRSGQAEATGGPDDFGYTWNDAEPFNWIDATGGTDAGLSGYSSGQATGAIALPFAFKFYENTYPAVFIAASGYLGFTSMGGWSGQQQFPSPATPNNVIAPYWSPFILSGGGPTGRIYYTSGGTAPNRYFVVEWYQVPGEYSSATNDYTFEVILHENGDIVFQYGTMNYGSSGYSCGAAGIEDASGLDGLKYRSSCNQMPSNTAVRFYRPVPAARVGIVPLHQGRHTHANETVEFGMPIRNRGELGSDTFDITLSSSWPANLYAADGITPLADTDGDATPDTGLLAQGNVVTVVVKVTTPAGATVGDNNLASVSARSSVNTGVVRTSSLRTAVPAPFAQVYTDNPDYDMSFYLAQPSGQVHRPATAPLRYGNSPAIAEAPNGGFVYVWTVSRCLNTNCSLYGSEIEYAILNRHGEVVRPAGKLTDLSGSSTYAFDQTPVVAVAPDGRIGVLWYRYYFQWLGGSGQYNYNIYFSALDSAGQVVLGPTNVTNNIAWGPTNAIDVPQFFAPAIVSTGDSRFVLAWSKFFYGPPTGSCTNFCSATEVHFAVRNSSGGEVRAPAALAAVTPGSGISYYDPSLARLAGNRALLTFGYQSDIRLAVLDSAGNVVQGSTGISTEGSNIFDLRPDAAQLADGRIVVAWGGWQDGNYRVRFATLTSSYALQAPPAFLSNPAAVTGDYAVSVAADAAGNAVLTWTDSDYNYRRYLYYALVNGLGGVLTPPMIFHTPAAGAPYLITSFQGYGNTTFSSTPAAGVDTWVTSTLLNGTPPGGAGGLPIALGNHGLTAPAAITLTATLPLSVTYVSDTSGVTPSVAGDTITWVLPGLGWLESLRFNLVLSIPSSPLGTTFPVSLVVETAEGDAVPADNQAQGSLLAAELLYLPSILR